MYKYIINSEEQARQLSVLIYELMYPPHFTPSGHENYLFGWEYDGEDWLILIPENYECPIFQKENFDSVIHELGVILNGAISDGEGAQLVEYLKTGKIILDKIIPSGLIIKEYFK